jgi:hypothetical protein
MNEGRMDRFGERLVAWVAPVQPTWHRVTFFTVGLPVAAVYLVVSRAVMVLVLGFVGVALLALAGVTPSLLRWLF